MANNEAIIGMIPTGLFPVIASLGLFDERETRFELATYSLEGYRSTS